jgi:hypothetical protein
MLSCHRGLHPSALNRRGCGPEPAAASSETGGGAHRIAADPSQVLRADSTVARRNRALTPSRDEGTESGVRFRDRPGARLSGLARRAARSAPPLRRLVGRSR